MEFNINIPTSLKDITLKQYKKFLKIQDGIENTTFLQLKIIEIFGQRTRFSTSGPMML